MTYRPNRRDPLTERVARTARETVSDPYAYSEGPAEPQYIAPPPDLADSLLVRWGPLALLALLVLIVLGVL